jgi:PQQ-dependent catabolism-associated CXXCW motif protein
MHRRICWSWRSTVCALGLLLLTNCAEYQYQEDYASPAPAADASTASTVLMGDGLVYTRVEQCSNLGAVETDPAFTAPPDGMSRATWQGMMREIYDDIHEIDKACSEGRFYTRTLKGNVLRYGLLSPAGSPLPSAINPTPATQKPSAPKTQQQFFAEENVDFGVKPQRALQTNVGTATPIALPPEIGKTLSTRALRDMLRDGGPLLVDVLNGEHEYTIRGASYIPDGGLPGTFTDEIQQRLAAELTRLTIGRTDYPIVFFCLGARCWESYNAVLRAYNAGYRNLYWYRGGINAWTEAGLDVSPLVE